MHGNSQAPSPQTYGAKLSAHWLNVLGPEQAAALLEEFRSDWMPAETESNGSPLPGASLSWQDWLARHFPHVCTQPFGERHRRLWEWFESLEPGERPRPRVEVWPRGGAKSSTAELGVARCCVRLARRYALYVSETQEQADKHVAAIASLLERAGVERALNKYGSSKGWRRQELRAANGFSVSAYGLDTAARGVKLDEFRPDLIVFDDLDSQDDSTRTVDKKINALTTAVIPAESADCAHLFLQNLIHEESIFAMLADGRADFLHDREPACVEPAVRDLRTEIVDRGDGQQVYRITGGEATWEGQSLATCEKQINAWGLRAFQREAQHEVVGGRGYYFNVGMLGTCRPADMPPLASVCLAGDLAATEGGGDWTVLLLLGRAANSTYYVLAAIRGQWASDRVRACIKLATAYYQAAYPKLRRRLPQDGGQAGKDQAQQLKKADSGLHIVSVTGNKAVRARGFAEQVNLGNVTLVEADLPEFLLDRIEGGKPLAETLGWQRWHREYREVLRKFREDETDQLDDDVDASADAFNELTGGGWFSDPAATTALLNRGREKVPT